MERLTELDVLLTFKETEDFLRPLLQQQKSAIQGRQHRVTLLATVLVNVVYFVFQGAM